MVAVLDFVNFLDRYGNGNGNGTAVRFSGKFPVNYRSMVKLPFNGVMVKLPVPLSGKVVKLPFIGKHIIEW